MVMKNLYLTLVTNLKSLDQGSSNTKNTLRELVVKICRKIKLKKLLKQFIFVAHISTELAPVVQVWLSIGQIADQWIGAFKPN